VQAEFGGKVGNGGLRQVAMVVPNQVSCWRDIHQISETPPEVLPEKRRIFSQPTPAGPA